MATSCENINFSENQDGGGSHLEYLKFPLVLMIYTGLKISVVRNGDTTI